MNKRVENVKEKERKMMEDYGYFVHLVYETEAKEMGGLCNVHTHGLEESFGHKDLQIILPLPPQQNHGLINSIVQQIINDKRTFEPNVEQEKVLVGEFKVMFKEFQEGGRTVLRLLLPDPKGYLPTDDKCDDMYKRQLEEIE